MKRRLSYPSIIAGLLVGVAAGFFAGKYFWQSKNDNASQFGTDWQEVRQDAPVPVSDQPGDLKKDHDIKAPISEEEMSARINRSKIAGRTDTLANMGLLENDDKVRQEEDSDLQEAIVIKRDQLLESLSVVLKEEKQTTEFDSLAQQVSGVHDEGNPVKLRIEFWSSPVHYRGYRMANGKLVIYGIIPMDSVCVDAISGDTVLIRTNDEQYLFHRTLIFEPLNPEIPETEDDTTKVYEY